MRELRLLLTNSCNYNCFFCHREGMQKEIEKNAFNLKDYIYLHNVFKELYSTETVTLTGGGASSKKRFFRYFKRIKKRRC